MTTTANEEFTAFTQEDIVYDDGCIPQRWECGKDNPLTHVNREDPEHVIHEECFYQLPRREREEFIAIKDVPSGKPTASEKVDAMIGESLDADEDDEEYQLEEPVEFSISASAGIPEGESSEEEYYVEEVKVPKGMSIINVEFGKE